MPIDQKIALITGASRGLGQAMAIALGKKGLHIAATATSQEGVDRINETFKKENIQGKGFILDVCNPQAIEETVAKITESFSAAPLILVNNAGITQDNLLLRMKPDQWEKVIDTNLNSVYRMSKACIKGMVKARWGRIINISSVVASMGNPGQANYCAAKAGMIGFTKSLASEMAGAGITVNVVAPGFIDTDMTRQLTEQQKEAIHNMIPMKRIGKPEEVSQVVAFLASDEASYITGQTWHVNGGLYMA